MNREAGIPWPEGIKKTKQRRQVLEALADCDAPVTAMDLSARLESRGTAVWLSTIYRILDTFTACDLVQKTTVLDSGLAVYELQDNQHKHYAVCVLCNRVIHMEICPLESFHPQLSEQGFHVLGHRLQIYGYCASCVGNKITSLATP